MSAATAAILVISLLPSSLTAAEDGGALPAAAGLTSDVGRRDITAGADIWKRDRKTFAYEDTTVHMNGSEFSYCLTSEDLNDLRVKKTFDVRPDTQYVAVAYIKTENAANEDNSDKSCATISVGDWNCSTGLVGTNDWTKVEVSFNSGNKTTADVSMNLGYWGNICSGTAWFDGIAVIEQTVYQAEAAGKRNITEQAKMWKRDRGSCAYEDPTVHRSGSEFSYCITSTEANDVRIVKTFEVDEYTEYIASAYIKTENVVNVENKDSTLSASIGTDIDTWSCSTGLVGNNDWTRVYVIFDSEDRNTVDISMNLGYAYNTSTGTAWFDNLELVKLKKVSKKNDVTNKAQMWRRDLRSYAYEDTTVHTSGSEYSYCLTSEDANDVRITKTFDVKENTDYVVTAFIRTENAVSAEKPSGTACATISVGDWNCSDGLSGTSGWKKFSVNFNSGNKTTADVSMNLGYWNNTCTGTAWFDGITITEKRLHDYESRKVAFWCYQQLTTKERKIYDLAFDWLSDTNNDMSGSEQKMINVNISDCFDKLGPFASESAAYDYAYSYYERPLESFKLDNPTFADFSYATALKCTQKSDGVYINEQNGAYLFMSKAESKNSSSYDNLSYQEARSMLEGKVKDVVNGIPSYCVTNYAKLLYLVKWIGSNTEYKDSYYPPAYNILVEGDRCCCQGYAKSMKTLCDAVGIRCVCIDNGEHMWNAVKMGDGKWYMLDVGWMDNDNGCLDYCDFLMFLVSSESMSDWDSWHPEQGNWSEKNHFLVTGNAWPKGIGHPFLSETDFVSRDTDPERIDVIYPDEGGDGFFTCTLADADPEKSVIMWYRDSDCTEHIEQPSELRCTYENNKIKIKAVGTARASVYYFRVDNGFNCTEPVKVNMTKICG